MGQLISSTGPVSRVTVSHYSRGYRYLILLDFSILNPQILTQNAAEEAHFVAFLHGVPLRLSATQREGTHSGTGALAAGDGGWNPR